MEAWWNVLNLPTQVFYGIAFVSTAVLFLQMALMFFGLGDFDVDVDTDGLDVHDGGLGFLSMRSVVAFLTGFGWSGALASKSGLSLLVSVTIATVVGLSAMAVVVLLMRALYGLGSEGTLDYANAVGQVGNVYLPIPAAMAGNGQVEVRVQGRLCTVRAFTRSNQRLPNRLPVRVVGVIDQQTLLVEPFDAPTADTPTATEPVHPKEG